MLRQSSSVSDVAAKAKREASCIPRRTRKGSSTKAALVWRRTRFFKSASPPQKSSTCSVRDSQQPIAHASSNEVGLSQRRRLPKDARQLIWYRFHHGERTYRAHSAIARRGIEPVATAGI